jgi:hypothetical protein
MLNLGGGPAYILSLRNVPKTQAEPCRAEIARLETTLGRGQADANVIGSDPEFTAARLHRQPTPQTVEQTELDVEKKIKAALTLAR